MAMIDMPYEFVEEYKANKMETLTKLQTAIRKSVPTGFNVHKEPQFDLDTKITELFERDLTFKMKGIDHIAKSLGTLGGGNHFIELNETQEGKLLLVVHSGSRNLGQQVAKHHQDIAEKNFLDRKPTQEEIEAVDPKDRQQFIKNFKGDKLIDDTPEKGLEYLVGEQVEDYLNDMGIAQDYAHLNRNFILLQIFEELGYEDYFDTPLHTVHNYIDIENKIIRKGAIYADPDQLIIIPLNMRDGSIIGYGKWNKDANYSAPHGAGRVMSRNVAKKEIKLEDFKETMKDVVSWTINEHTLDEAPFAYKSKEEIIEGIKALVNIKEIIKPVFNFKDDTSNGRRK